MRTKSDGQAVQEQRARLLREAGDADGLVVEEPAADIGEVEEVGDGLGVAVRVLRVEHAEELREPVAKDDLHGLHLRRVLVVDPELLALALLVAPAEPLRREVLRGLPLFLRRHDQTHPFTTA